MKVFFLRLIMLCCFGLLVATTLSIAQSATFYACAETSFKLRGVSGYDEYEWSLNGSIISGADSSILPVEALSAEEVGNDAILNNYALKVRNTDGCWSEEAVFAVYILPKLFVSTEGFVPPYCENLVQEVNLTALVNGGTGTTALSLPAGVGVTYEWSVVESGHPDCNASIVTGENNAIATVKTPATSDVANSYKVKIAYSYPEAVNVATEVAGDCNDESTEAIYALPAPTKPSINYIHL